jgi:hypothetical protein
MIWNRLPELTPKRVTIILTTYLVLLFLLVVSIDRCNTHKHEASLLSENLEAERISSQKLGDGYARELSLTRSQYEERLETVIDSLRRKHGKEMAKINRILSHTRIELRDARDNIRIAWRDSIIPGETIRVGRVIKSDHPCITVKVYQPENDSAAYLTYGFEINGELFVYKGKRTKDFRIFGRRIFRYGSRSTDAKMFVNCGDSVQVNIEQIRIID